MKKTAVIFDMDGVISDTQSFHAEIESKILKELGIRISPDAITNKYAGVSDEVMFHEIFEQNTIDTDIIPDIIQKKWHMMENATKGNVKSISHSIDLIRILKQNNFLLAVASASTKTFIQTVINSLHIEKYFDTLVSANEVQNGKPAPDIFLLAAEKLNVKPEEAIVIEDGRSGMLGAKAAEMRCIGLVNDKQGNYPATVVISSLDEITIPLIHML